MQAESIREAPWLQHERASTAELPERAEAVVVGAGIVGLTTALLLARSGVEVCVLEARWPGSGTTGRSTAKATVLQRTRASQIARERGADVARDYLTANISGLALLQELAQAHPDVGEAADAWTFATDDHGADSIRAEARVLQEHGLAAVLAQPEELPFATTSAVQLPEQLRLDPSALVARLVEELQALDVPVVFPARAVAVRSAHDEFEVVVAGPEDGDEQRIAATWVVLATLMPFPLRTALFASATPQMSYCLAGRPTTGAVPSGMYISAGKRTRSLRSIPVDDGDDLLLVGGSGHHVGHDLPASAHVDELASWAQEMYGLGVTHQWAAHDYASADLLPHIGRAPFGPERLLVATGFGKWGMANGAAAGQILSGLVRGEPPAWAGSFAPRVADGRRGWARFLAANLDVGWGLARGWVADPGKGKPGPGEGVVRRCPGRHPRAVSEVDGVRRSRSAVCTHLGGIVRWNDAEQTWDCPLHGSRFAADGAVLTGPAVEPLRG